MRFFRLHSTVLSFSLMALAGFLAYVDVPAAHSQGIITGGITGTVVDQSGAVIPGAPVQARNESTGTVLQGKSDSVGVFHIADVPIGSYTVTVTATGFGPTRLTHVFVVAGNATPLGKVSLSLGKAAETVQVESSAADLINTESAQFETVLSTEQVATAPVAGALDDVALVSPGVVITHGSTEFSNTNGENFSVNGQRGRSNNSEIDGQTNNDTSIGGPSFFFDNQDAIQEVQVVTTDMGAQYGRNMGAIVNYITKSGTNSFHGTGFEIYTGSWLSSLMQWQKAPQWGYCPQGQNANCTSNPTSPFYGDPLPVVPRFVQNVWGGTFGGPVLKNKLWLFGSTLWDHTYESGQTLTSAGAFFPDATGYATLKSVFPGNPAVAAGAANGPYSSPLGNPTTIDSTSLCAADSLPVSGSGCLMTVTDGTSVANVEVAQFERTFPTVILDQEHLGRLDYQMTSKDRFYVRYNYQNNPYTNAFYIVPYYVAAAGGFTNVNGITREVGGDWTHTFTSNIVNQARYAFQQSNIGFYGGAIPSCTISNQTTCSSYVGLGAPLTGYGYDFEGAFPQGRVIKVNQVQDNATINKGRHAIYFGFEFDSQHSPWGWLPNDEGAFNFAPGAAVNAANPSGIPFNYSKASLAALTTNGGCIDPTTGGNDCDNGLTGFLEGIGELTLSQGNTTIPFVENDFDFYFQDNFKLTPNFTWNLGVRFEFFGQAVNFLHSETVARQTGSHPFWNTSLPLSATTTPYVSNDLHNIEPRIGFAYKPPFLPKMVVHGGYSINADPEFYGIFIDGATAAPAVDSGAFACDPEATPPVNCVPSGGLTFGTVQAADDQYIPTGGDPRVNPIQTFSNNLHNAQGETYSLGLQYQVFPTAVADVRYVGNHTYGNYQGVNANPDILDVQSAFPGYGAGISVCTDPTAIGYTRPNCNYGDLLSTGNGAFSLYNALQASLTARNYHGFTGTFSYTWSRTIDNATDFTLSPSGPGGGQASALAQDPLNSDVGERGLNGNSYPQVVSIQLSYNTPWFSSQHGLLGRLLGGYLLNMMYQYNGGQPYNPIQNSTVVQSLPIAGILCAAYPDTFACGYTGNTQNATQAQEYAQATTSFCDFAFATVFGNPCRPDLSNPAAPLPSIGINLGPLGYYDYVTGNSTTPSTEHWTWNNQYEAIARNNPFPGVGRNILRGNSWNDLDLSAGKTFHLTERFSTQIMVSVYNLFNRGYYGTPDLYVEDSLTGGFETTKFAPGTVPESGAGNGSFPQGLGNRNLALTGKIIF